MNKLFFMRHITTAIVTALLMLSPSSSWAQSNETVIEKMTVEPETSYRLSFQANSGGKEAQWLLRTIDQNGEFPHAGHYENDWQTIVADTTSYRHSFRTTPGAQTVEFAIQNGEGKVEVSDVTLEEIEPENLLINGDFSEGAGNYSGWSEHLNTRFIEADGKTALKIEHNGYALTDPVPVDAGALYEFARKSTTPAYVLIYDADMSLLTPAPYDRTKELRMPDTAAYLRMLYQTSFDHIPIYRTKTITGVGLVRKEEGKVTSAAGPHYPAEIILDGKCDPREKRAASELRHWIREITGKRVPLLAQPSKKDNTKFFLGAQLATEYAEDLKFLAGSDGYAVRRDGNRIHIFGSHPRGTMFGVFALLEKNTDIIWPRPHPDFAAIFSKKAEIEFSNTDFRSRPAFEIRELNFHGGDPNPVLSHNWIGRNGGNSPMKLGKGFQYLRWLAGAQIGAGGGYIWTFMGLEQEDETLYPLVNGNRLRNMWRQPCYTHEGVPKVMADKARKILSSVPGKEVEFLISRVGDNWEVCNCDECMKPIDLADGTQLVSESTNSVNNRLFFSTRNYMMLNQMAENLVKDNPDLKLHTHAYIFAAEPPKVKLHPAIVPHFAAYPTKDERYPILEQKSEAGAVWTRRFRQWGEEQDVSFGFFGYYYASGFNALADTAGPDFKALAEMGGIHAHNEGHPSDSEELNSWDIDGIEKWIIAKLQWDPTQDPAALRDQYIVRTYQDAAPQMREFYQLINDSWHDPTNPTVVNCHTAANQLFEEFIVNSGLEKRARTLLAEAQNVASHSASKKLIERTLAKFDELAGALNRLPVPLVPESTEQWSQYESPHWYKAHEVGDFKRIANWEPLPEGRTPTHKTTIAMMRDNTHLYFKIDAFNDLIAADNSPPTKTDSFPQDDRVEIVIRSGNDTFYFAVGSDSGTYALKNWNTAEPWSNETDVVYLALDGKWSALLAIPFSDLGAIAGKMDLDAKFCRVVNPANSKREESTLNGRGILNNHKMLRSPMELGK